MMTNSIRLAISTEDSRMSLVRINTDATNEELYELALAINSLQDQDLKEVVRTERIVLF